ncbi:MAG: outer membrane protein assembly factor BamC [Gammaproteobacteria bacterium]|nr:outer membrane protein assembly factor BamC [Gammaproteobacteria bacterium]
MQRNLLVVLVGVLLGLSACSVVDERKAEYKNLEPTANLEVPPDLLSMEAEDELAVALAPLGGSVTLSEFEQNEKKKGQPLDTTSVDAPVGDGFRWERDGAARWLLVTGTPAQWWQEIERFWSLRDVKVEKENPALGMMQTAWITGGEASTSASLKEDLSQLYDSKIKDQYIVRFEAGIEAGTTEIHVVHRGLQEVVIDGQMHWVPRSSENELEIELLKQLTIYISKKEDAEAETITADLPPSVKLARLVEADGMLSLRINLPFAKAWRRTGNALVQMDLSIDDFNRSTGLIEITGMMSEQHKKKSFAQRLFGSEEVEPEEKFTLQLEDLDSEVMMTLRDKNTGELHDSPDVKEFFQRLALLLNRD